MRPPSLAISDDASVQEGQLGQAARDAVRHTNAVGFDLDEPSGAAMAFESMADVAAAIPLPAGGRSLARLSGLAAVADVDLALGRFIEAHTDALAILAELDGPTARPRERWGVWAAEGPQATVQAQAVDGRWLLSGIKPWCSGAGICTHALVTAPGPDGPALWAVAIESATVRARAGNWRSVGLSGTATEPVEFLDAPASLVGAPGGYLTRPGFWHGAIGVAAVWWGGAAGIAAPLYEAASAGLTNPHAEAHLGAVEVMLESTAALLRQAAVGMDKDPGDVGERAALTVRGAVEAAATEIIARVGRALGPGPLCHDRAHARRVADLSVYLRQTHAERDLARLAALAAGRR
ncbi:MAG TPA: acyl-CoA dehydrogenase [Frankiaceae bacterium]|nr:acyl-CoA dehydrogenase [Frankiaceae bacterium]